jgi:prepilin signal peptidase PulO-like enzyme (type II secretory pathway)
VLLRDGVARARAATIPFGPCLALGAAVAWAAGGDLLAACAGA